MTVRKENALSLRLRPLGVPAIGPRLKIKDGVGWAKFYKVESDSCEFGWRTGVATRFPFWLGTYRQSMPRPQTLRAVSVGTFRRTFFRILQTGMPTWPSVAPPPELVPEQFDFRSGTGFWSN